MSQGLLLLFAAIVFSLMITGLYLTMMEFLKISEDPSVRKGALAPVHTKQKRVASNDA